MTDRTNLNKRIIETLGNETMSLHDLAIKTGSSDMGIRSALRAMVLRGELWRTVRRDKVQLFTVSPLKVKARG